MRKVERIKQRKLRNALINTMHEMVSEIAHGFIKGLGTIALIIQILIPVILLQLNVNTIKAIIYSVILLFITKYIKEVGYKVNNKTERGLPLPNDFYVIKDEYGFISLREGFEQDAILYLYDVEDYIRGKGWLK